MIVTLPSYDIVTEYLSQFSKPVIEEAIKNSINVKKLTGKEVSRAEFEKIIEAFSYDLLFINGHGSQFEVYGNSFNEFILKEGENEEKVVGKVIYARACDAASSLGRSIVEKNPQSCFIGYEFPFEFYHDATWEASPLKDKTAEIFFIPSNLILFSLFKGNTVLEADKK